MKSGIPLFLNREDERFFSNRPQELKDELQVLLNEVIVAQEENTSDARRKLALLLENWSIELLDPHWGAFKELVDRFIRNEQLLSGDLNRRCIQILTALQ